MSRPLFTATDTLLGLFRHGDISAKFDELDVDKNGVLSPDEVSKVIMDCLKVERNMAE